MLVALDAIAPYLLDNSVLGLEPLLPSRSFYPSVENHIIEIRVRGSSSTRSYYAMVSEFGSQEFPSSSSSIPEQKLVYFLDQDKHVDLGCDRYDHESSKEIRDRILVVSRGGCTFYRKAVWAQEAGARAVLFVNHVEGEAPFRAVGAPASQEQPALPANIQLAIPSAMLDLEDGVDLLQFSVQENGSIEFIQLAWKSPFRLKLNNLPVHNVMVINF